MVRVSLAAPLGGKAVSAMLQTSFGNIVIDLLLRPCLSFGNGDIDRIGMVHGSGPLADDVKNPLQLMGIRFFKEHVADLIPGPHPAAGDDDVFVDSQSRRLR